MNNRRKKKMKCPVCGYEDTNVVDSRPTDNGSIRRRRECKRCKKRFTTFEIVDTVPMVVVKKDGSREVFDRNKIKVGIMNACYKRPVSDDQIEAVVSEIESELQNMLQPEYSSQQIGVLVMEKLRKLDEVSYVRFASVYREFKDVGSFVAEIKGLNKEADCDK